MSDFIAQIIMGTLIGATIAACVAIALLALCAGVRKILS